MPVVDCPCYRDRLVVAFTAGVVGVGKPTCGAWVGQVLWLGPERDGD